LLLLGLEVRDELAQRSGEDASPDSGGRHRRPSSHGGATSQPAPARWPPAP